MQPPSDKMTPWTSVTVTHLWCKPSTSRTQSSRDLNHGRLNQSPMQNSKNFFPSVHTYVQTQHLCWESIFPLLGRSLLFLWRTVQICRESVSFWTSFSTLFSKMCTTVVQKHWQYHTHKPATKWNVHQYPFLQFAGHVDQGNRRGSYESRGSEGSAGGTAETTGKSEGWPYTLPAPPTTHHSLVPRPHPQGERVWLHKPNFLG